MFLAALFIIAKGWKQPISLSTGECANKGRHIHTMEHYSAMKRNEVAHATYHNMNEPCRHYAK